MRPIAKTWLSALFVCSLFGASAMAEQRNRTFNINLYGGFAFGIGEGENVGNAHPVNGVAFGFGLDYKIQPKIALSIDFLHLVKGHNTNVGGVVNNYTLSFVEMPIQIKWIPVPQFQLSAGPYLASLLISAIQESQGQYLPVKGQFRNDFGFTVGMWAGFLAGNVLSVGLNARYDHGLADVQADGNPETSISTRTLILMGTIGFAFD